MLSGYKVGPFTDVSNLWGDKLWDFLNSKNIVNKMITSTNLNRTAAEGISIELLEKFGEGTKQNRVKQFIGFLIRQVMELNGYKHDKYGVRTIYNSMFKKASRYGWRNDKNT